MLEAADRVLARVVSEEVSAFFDRLHRGPASRFTAAPRSASCTDATRVDAVETADGRRFKCDAAIVGIGIVPNVELASGAGLECANGIVVDEHARTADHNIARVRRLHEPSAPLYARSVRLESVPNAIHQAKVAAATLLGTPGAYAECRGSGRTNTT